MFDQRVRRRHRCFLHPHDRGFPARGDTARHCQQLHRRSDLAVSGGIVQLSISTGVVWQRGLWRSAYVFCVTNLNEKTAKVAKLSVFAILSMSLFTLWLEPFTSLKGAIVQSVIEQLARLASKIFDLGISVFWILIYFRATGAISRECRATGTTKERTACSGK